MNWEAVGLYSLLIVSVFWQIWYWGPKVRYQLSSPMILFWFSTHLLLSTIGTILFMFMPGPLVGFISISVAYKGYFYLTLVLGLIVMPALKTLAMKHSGPFASVVVFFYLFVYLYTLGGLVFLHEVSWVAPGSTLLWAGHAAIAPSPAFDYMPAPGNRGLILGSLVVTAMVTEWSWSPKSMAIVLEWNNLHVRTACQMARNLEGPTLYGPSIPGFKAVCLLNPDAVWNGVGVPNQFIMTGEEGWPDRMYGASCILCTNEGSSAFLHWKKIDSFCAGIADCHYNYCTPAVMKFEAAQQSGELQLGLTSQFLGNLEVLRHGMRGPEGLEYFAGNEKQMQFFFNKFLETQTMWANAFDKAANFMNPGASISIYETLDTPDHPWVGGYVSGVFNSAGEPQMFVSLYDQWKVIGEAGARTPGWA